MKKIIQSYSQDFKMPHLYREDLKKIEQIISDELEAQKYKIECGGYEYESIDEIPNDTSSANEFSIKTYHPYIDLEFNKYNSRLYAGGDDLKMTGAIKKVEEIIQNKERKVLWFFSQIAFWIAPYLFIGPLIVLVGLIKKGAAFHMIGFLLLLSLSSAIWLWISYYNRLKTFSIIEFINKKDRHNFFTRNKDQIILLVMGAIVGAIATVIIQNIFVK